MSSPTWMHGARPFEVSDYQGPCWRLVEAQHYVSTMKIADTLDDQALLESLIEATKPIYPPDCAHLHVLLKTPFRYGAVYPNGSRFRRAGRTLGVYYASIEPKTAVAELAFYRLLFFVEAPGLPWPNNPAEYSAFSVNIATQRLLDLTAPPMIAFEAQWTHPTDYSACQALADAARGSAVEAIRYESVRDPERGRNLAILTCSVFEGRMPFDQQTWRIRLSQTGIQARCDHPRLDIDFTRQTFASDPRIAAFDWNRPAI